MCCDEPRRHHIICTLAQAGTILLGKPRARARVVVMLPFSKKLLWLQRGCNFWKLVLRMVAVAGFAVMHAAFEKTYLAAAGAILLEIHALFAGRCRVTC